MIEGSCHCEAIKFKVAETPEWLTDCNCSLCRRIGALWAHVSIESVELIYVKGTSIEYAHGEKNLALHSCSTCGCTTHWERLKPELPSRMGVNFRMCTLDERSRYRVRPFDGAETWEYLD